MANALAAVPFETTNGVNVRSGPSTDHSVVTAVSSHTKVEVLEHDPAGWSKVKVNGYTGFIRSDFLSICPGSGDVTFKTTEVVNLRDGASTDDRILMKVTPDNDVEVHNHSPAGWSEVTVNGVSGFIRSDYLTVQGLDPDFSSSSGTNETSQPVATLVTTGIVNLRAGPSTNDNILKKVSAGASAEVLEQNTNGWSRVKVNGMEGYIRSDLLRSGGSKAGESGAGGNGNVELLKLSQVKASMTNGVPFRVLDLKTGLTYTLVSFSKGKHADVDTATAADTQTLKDTYGGTWSWRARPVWVYLGDRVFAAAMTGMPHAGTSIPGNGAGGQFCLHFLETVTNNKRYQADLRSAVAEAYAWTSR